MATPAPGVESTKEVASVVRDLLASCKSRAEVAAVLERMARADSVLLTALFEKYRPHYVRDLCWDAVRAESSEVRSETRRHARAKTDLGEFGSRMMLGLSRLERWTLPIPGGPRLMDASREQLLAATEALEAQIGALRSAKQFYLHLARNMARGQLVRNVYSPDQVYDCLAEVERGRA